MRHSQDCRVPHVPRRPHGQRPATLSVSPFVVEEITLTKCEIEQCRTRDVMIVTSH